MWTQEVQKNLLLTFHELKSGLCHSIADQCRVLVLSIWIRNRTARPRHFLKCGTGVRQKATALHDEAACGRYQQVAVTIAWSWNNQHIYWLKFTWTHNFRSQFWFSIQSSKPERRYLKPGYSCDTLRLKTVLCLQPCAALAVRIHYVKWYGNQCKTAPSRNFKVVFYCP